MHWKTVNGHEYLYRRFTNRADSLGPRNAETEARLQKFTAGKAAAAERVTGLAERLRVQGRLARALGIGRVPRVAARVLEAVNAEPDLRNQVTVVGTHALWAYETVARLIVEHLPQYPLAPADIAGFSEEVRLSFEITRGVFRLPS